ncbi:restriction endonuclease subunit S [Burkholderia ubonensis]|uniref:restriction endonuclease subunit S n=1 Tax=Burkholderia ubonensis TaxID=101571 RepID=UPI000ABF3AFB|nr:restriction endonuclease subunit S [Burkholderia ubonensis]
MQSDRPIRLDSLAHINPARRVKKGAPIPFVEMAALPQYGRDIERKSLQIRHAKGAGSHFKNGDTLLARITPCLENGKTAQVRCLEAGSIGEGSTEFIVLSGIAPEDNDFIYYLCRDPDFRKYAIGRMEGTSGRQRVTWQSVAAYEFNCPAPEARRASAKLLSALDDRISLLRQTNATLESIAQALFKSWFIDFDPVRAKAQGREPEGMDADTAALFPDSFEDSALGEVPKGWGVSTLAEHVSAERGLSYKGAGLCLAGEGVPMHNLNSVLEGGDYKYAGIKYYSGEYKERHETISGDIVVANTEQGHSHRLIGFPAIIPSRYRRAIFSHHLYRVRLKPDTPLTTHTLYYMLMAPAVREQVIGCANGSTVNMLKVAGLEIPQFVCPSAQAARAFEGQAAVLRTQIESNIERAETLAALRDTLLPRLISGKLRLPEAEAQFDEALA